MSHLLSGQSIMLFMLLYVLPKTILNKSDTVGTLLPQKPVPRPPATLYSQTSKNAGHSPQDMMKFDYSDN